MYREFYQLNIKPFSISPDPRFLWMGEKHKEALATLRYGVLDNKGFLVLTGDVGTGKTTLINALCNGLKRDILVANISDPGLERLEFYNCIGRLFHFEKRFDSKEEFIGSLVHFLLVAHKQKKTVLLIIDEAQRISHELLEEIRVLSNIEKQNNKLINIFFVGQVEFNDILLDKKNRALRQRITLSYNIEPLTRKETGRYIEHRLHVAGAQRALFADASINRIHKYSGGYPRLINILCDHAMLTGYVREVKTISPPIITECARELSIASPDKGSWKKQSETFLRSKAQARKPHRLDGRKEIFTLLVIIVLFLLLVGGVYVRFFEADKLLQRLFWPIPTRVGENAVTHPAHRVHEIRLGKGGQENMRGPASASRSERTANEAPSFVESGAHHRLTAVEPRQSGTAINPNRDWKRPILVEPDPLSGTDSREAAVSTTTESPEESVDIPDGLLIILFRSNSNSISQQDIDRLDPFVLALQKVADLQVEVRGYSDSLGNEGYNQKVSEFRANVVKSYFMGKGIFSDRIVARGLGPQKPLASNTNPSGRKANRRVEVELIRLQGFD